MSNPEIFRPKSNYLFAGSLYILCIGLALESILNGSLHNALSAIAWSSLICYVTYLLFIRPKITFFDEGLTITNPFHETTVGWGDIISIDARYTMYVTLQGDKSGIEKIHAWAAPAPGRYHARTIHPTEIHGMRIPNPANMRPGESPRTHSGVATHLARLRFDAFHANKFRNIVRCDRFNQNAIRALVTLAIICLGFWLF